MPHSENVRMFRLQYRQLNMQMLDSDIYVPHKAGTCLQVRNPEICADVGTCIILPPLTQLSTLNITTSSTGTPAHIVIWQRYDLVCENDPRLYISPDNMHDEREFLAALSTQDNVPRDARA
jgi:hypothetical protein